MVKNVNFYVIFKKKNKKIVKWGEIEKST